MSGAWPLQPSIIFSLERSRKDLRRPFSLQIVYQISITYILGWCLYLATVFFIFIFFLLYFIIWGRMMVTNFKNLHLFKPAFIHQFKFKNEETYCIEVSRSFPAPFPDPWCSTRDRSHGHPGFCRNSPPSTTTWSCERGVDVTPTADSLSRTLWRSLSRCIRARVSFGNSLPPIHRLKIHI